MNLQPQNSFTVVRQISNHTDTNTYYVQAVIRNAYTDTIIDTLDLISRGSQRYSLNWLVPADPSGQGFYISIVTSVYTDSGYTTKSENYGDDESTYLVQDRILLGRVGGSGGGDSTDYDLIRKIVKDEITKIEKAEPAEMPEMRWDEVLSAISDLQDKVLAIPTQYQDLSPFFIGAVEMIKKAVADKEIPEGTDITPALDQLKALSATLNKVLDTVVTSESVITSDIQSSLKGFEDNVSGMLKGISFSIVPKISAPVTPEQPPEPPMDISSLSQ